jgi:iron complex outermembrane receptor protein
MQYVSSRIDAKSQTVFPFPEEGCMSHSLLFRSGRVLVLAALTLVLGASAAVAQQSRVEGTVRSAQNRDPVANARVSVVGTNLFATTNENGYYAIENVPVGTYDVRVQVIGFQSVVFTNQRVAAGLPTTVNFELAPSILRIEGVVVTGVAEQTQAVKLPFTVE